MEKFVTAICVGCIILSLSLFVFWRIEHRATADQRARADAIESMLERTQSKNEDLIAKIGELSNTLNEINSKRTMYVRKLKSTSMFDNNVLQELIARHELDSEAIADEWVKVALDSPLIAGE